MKKLLSLLVLSLAAFSAQADDLVMPASLADYRRELANAFVQGVFNAKDSVIPGENKPTYQLTLTRDPGKTGDVFVYRFVRTAPDGLCGGIVYQNVAGANELESTDCN